MTAVPAAMPTAGSDTGAAAASVDVTDTSTVNARAADAAAMNADMTATTVMPALPAAAAAPPQAATVGIAAPIEARTMPARVIPAIVPAAEDELGPLDITGHRKRSRSARGQRCGRAGKNGCAQRKRNGKNKFLH